MEKGTKLTTGKAAKLLGIGRVGVHARIASGTLKAEQVAGHLWVIDSEEVERQLAAYGYGKMSRKHTGE